MNVYVLRGVIYNEGSKMIAIFSDFEKAEKTRLSLLDKTFYEGLEIREKNLDESYEEIVKNVDDSGYLMYQEA